MRLNMPRKTKEIIKINDDLLHLPSLILGRKNSKNPIYFKKISQLPFEEGLLEIIKLNMYNNTYHLDKSIQCSSYKRRSSEDLYKICKAYYPDLTYYTLLKTLHILVNNKKIRMLFCPGINKYVYYRFRGDSNTYAAQCISFMFAPKDRKNELGIVVKTLF